MENQTTPAQAVNEEQKQNVPVTPDVKPEGEPAAQVTPEVQNTDVNEFKTAEDEHKQGRLEPWIEERLARERRAKQREKERAEEARLRAEAAESELLRVRASMSGPTPSPQPKNNNDPMQAVKNLVRETLLEAEKERREKEAQQAQYQAEAIFAAKLDRGIEKYDDFKEVITSPSVPFTQIMKAFLETIPNPEDFSYNSIKYNVNKLQEISQLHPVMQAVQMNELYKKFSEKSGRKTTTQAPPPPKSLTSGNAGQKDPNEMSYDEVKAVLTPRRQKT